jgi:hypothetical protein
MYQTAKSFRTFCTLAVILTAPVAATAADGQGPCERIRAACEGAGFVEGAARMGIGLQVDCIVPIMWGMPQRPAARRPLPQVNPRLVAECAAGRPHFGRPGASFAEPISQPSRPSPPVPEVFRPNDNPRRARVAGSAAAPPVNTPLPEAELLEHPTAPDCELKSAPEIDNPAALRAVKLDYEQQCYRQSEFILRARMERLQDAVRKTIESVKGQDVKDQDAKGQDAKGQDAKGQERAPAQ